MSRADAGPENLTRRSVAGVLWMAGGRGTNAVLQLLVLVVLARMLAPADFGVVSAALVVIGFSAIFAHLGLGPAVVQRPVLERRHRDTALTVSVVIGVAFGGLVAVAAPLAAAFFRVDALVPVLRALALVFPLQGVAVVAESLARRELRFRWLSVVDVTAYAVGYGVVGIALAYAGYGAWALVAAELVKVLARTAILLGGQHGRARPGWDTGAFRELMYFGGGFTVARIANYLAVQGDNLVVGRALGPAALGVYGRAYQLMAAPAAALGDVLDTVLFPAMARVQADRPRLAAAYRRAVAMVAAAVLPLSVVVVILAPEIIRVALGPRWSAAVLPFQVLATGMLFRTSYKMSDSLARATGSVYRRAWRQFVYAGLVIGGALLGQRWGIAGVAAAVVLALAVNFSLMAHLSLSVSGLSWAGFARVHLPPAALAAACLPVTWGMAAALRDAALPALVVLGASAATTAAWGLLLVWSAPAVFLGPDVVWMLATLRSYLPAHRRRPALPAPASVSEAP